MLMFQNVFCYYTIYDHYHNLHVIIIGINYIISSDFKLSENLETITY